MWCNVVNEAGGRALPTGPGGVALQIAHCDVLWKKQENYFVVLATIAN